ncbi:hypothetical protein HPP92_005168 [Vanilla planifolia]|uniref:mRNA-decapping enzyme-like protein n=1 Tax=Vanilla planifolia TaxID=51239 RepID=A0A835RRP2_VANPL|nr:hypothetical protein HPP92_005168 [Vanilla planifolia]
MSKLMPNLDRQSAKVLNLTVLQRIDPYVEEILMTAAHVTFYEFNVDLNQWSRKDVEGSLFVVKRNTQPRFQFIVMNRRSTDNLVEDLLEILSLKFKSHIYCTEILPKKLMVYGSIIHVIVKLLQVCLAVGSYTKFICNGWSLEPPTKSSAAVTDVPEDSFVNFFSAAMNIGNANTAITGPQHQPSSPTPSVSVHPAPNIQPVPSFPFSSAPIVPALESNESISSNNLASNLVKPSLFSHSPPSSALLMPPIASSVPAAPPLHPPVTMQRPYGTPLLQPFPPPAPPPSLTPTQNSAPVITRDKVRDALLRLVQFKLLEESSYLKRYRIMNFKGYPSPSCGLRVPLFPAISSLRISIVSSKRRVYHPVVRASVQLPAAIRPGGGAETDKLPSDVRKRTMDAVDYFGGRVTLGDVASRAGLKLNEAERALQALAADTNGFLEMHS